jgi:hypothetical protein
VKIACLLLALMGLGLLVISGSSERPIERAGYFKSSSNNRVMAFQAIRPIDPHEARDLLADVTWTPGQLTTAVLFLKPSVTPGHLLTRSPDVLAANGLWKDPSFADFKLRVDITPNGRLRYSGPWADGAADRFR